MVRNKRWRRRNLAAPERLEDVLERAGENRFARKQLPIPLPQWRAAVGPRIADRARPIVLERGVLAVKVTTSVWANELSMLAPQLIAKLAEAGFEVKSLRFRVGPLDVIEGIPQKRDYRRVPPPAVLAPELERSLARVEDDELRSMIERAARANLAWQTVPVKKGAPPASSGSPSSGPPSSGPPSSGPISGGLRAARGPRDAGRGTAPPDHTEGGSDEASPRSSGGGSDRQR
jgi:hypothetical protein